MPFDPHNNPLSYLRKRVGEVLATRIRTPGNGRGALFPKRHLLSGQTPCRFVRIAPGLPEIFQKLLSGLQYLAYFFARNLCRISRIWGKITIYHEKMISIRTFVEFKEYLYSSPMAVPRDTVRGE
jgi:hypothetical protein